MKDFKKGYSYHCKHIPSGEEWYLIGIDPEGNRVCAAGWPPSIGSLSECTDFEERKPLTKAEIRHRSIMFGDNWI